MENNISELNSLDLYKESREYWLDKLCGDIEKVSLYEDFSRTEEVVTAVYEGELNEELCKSVINISKNNDLALYVVLLSGLKVLLYKYTTQQDIIVSSPIYTKNENHSTYIDNKFIPFRDTLSSNMSFREVLRNIKVTVSEAYKNQHYPLNKVFELLKIVDKTFVNKSIVLSLDSLHKNNQSFNDEISISFSKSENNLRVKIYYNSKVFKEDTISKFCSNYFNVLNNGILNLDKPLSEMEMLSEEEQDTLLFKFNNTFAPYEREKTIHELFNEQVKSTPDNIALVFGHKKLTYRELNERAKEVAKTLREKGIVKHNIVAIMIDRSLEMIVGILGILKAGAAYLPIDPSYPMDRINYMLQDSKTKVLLSEEKYFGKVNFNGESLDLHAIHGEKSLTSQKEIKLEEQNKNLNEEVLENLSEATDLAYVIYTSGSTGNPKGVMIEHKQVNNFIQGVAKETDLVSYNSILCITTLSFDIFVLETLAPLTKGLKVVIANEMEQIDGEKLSECIVKNKVQIMQSTPSRLQLLMENEKFKAALTNLKVIFVGGDTLSLHLLNELKDYKTIKIYNMYGPTETTVWSTIKDLSNEHKITIGKPIQNTQIYIINKHNELQPIGVPGEICIGGEGVTRGYFEREELTAEKFIKNPFIKHIGKNSFENKESNLLDFPSKDKIYRTGDLGRWLPEGDIEFLGRIDNQVKIRGYRIELGEIESELVNCEAVKEAVVIDCEDEKGNKYLCGYIVTSGEVTSAKLREHLSINLPEYMIPSYFVPLKKMPLTPNGKLNRRALPKPDVNMLLAAKYEAPRNEIEIKLALLWSQILGVDTVGINDNFFDLGGQSLKATILVSRIHKELEVEIQVGEIFKMPTIKEISDYIEKTNKTLYKEITPIEEREYYEASAVQKRMYMLQQLDLNSIGYNMPMATEVHGKMDLKRLEQAIKELIKRHEVLRTSFHIIEEKIVQKVHRDTELNIEFIDNSNMRNSESKEIVDRIIKDFVKPFDLSKAPLMRTVIIKVEEQRHILLYDMHHIISDGSSYGILISEVAKLYKGEVLEDLKIQYKDFSAWQNKMQKSTIMKKQEEYWLSKFSDELPIIDLPRDYERSPVKSFEGDNINLLIEKDLSEKLSQIARDTGSTTYMVMLSALNILLHKYSGQTDIMIGTPIAGRTHADLEKLIGMFINTLVMRNKPVGTKTYKAFLEEVKETALGAYENQDYEFKDLLDKLEIHIDKSTNPLFDVMFVFQNMESEAVNFHDLTFSLVPQKNTTAKVDLTFTVKELRGQFVLNIQYSTKLYKKETIERMMNHFKNILKAITANIAIKLSEINILQEEEKHKIINEFNNTYLEYPKDKMIHKLFEEQVEKTPDKVAITYMDKSLTYRELNERSNAIARLLRSKGIKQNKIVAVMVESSLEMIIGLMAILKSGGAYMPISSEYPEDRIRYILEDSKPNVILTQRKLFNIVPSVADLEIIDLEDEKLYVEESENLEYINTSADLAYVIYTSGTTGKAKGVMTEHGNFLAYVNAFLKEYKITGDYNVLQQATYCFDGFVEEVYPALILGGSVFIVNKYDALNMDILQDIVKKNNINLISCSPLFLNELNKCKDMESVKIFISGGDVLKKEYYDNLIKNSKVYNTYGPTETTVCATYYKCLEEVHGNVPIGKPISNYKVYIFSEDNQLVPIGVSGEICVAGQGLARGYLNSEELTNKKFMYNEINKGERIYRTGDLGRWLPDGNIEFLGRADYQVKIRGFRIEIGEVENQLLKYEGIKEVIVVDIVDNQGIKNLCAYLVSDNELIIRELREYLRKELPEYMIPSYFTQLDKLPLDKNGKINRKALPKPDMNLVREIEYEAPRNELEEKLAAIWSEVLRVENIGINDNFFELGGHSLKATLLVAKIHKELNVALALKEVFMSPTIKGISKHLESIEKSIYSLIEKADEKEYYEVSSAQKRMYMLQQFDLQSVGYNMPGVMIVEGHLDLQRIEGIINELIQRHETLRTSFEFMEKRIVQKVNKNIDFKIDYVEKLEKPMDEIIKDFIRPFDLSKAPLLRVGLIKMEAAKHLIIFDMHHIISDGMSMEILVRELALLYEGKELKELKIQYKDYSEWQNKMLLSEKMKKQEEYWENRFSGEIPILNMPTDYPRPPVQAFEGDSTSFKLPKEITMSLKNIAKDTSSTMFMVLLSGVNILLSKYSGQEDIIVGTPIAGRSQVELQNIIGMFVNTLAMRNYPMGNKSYKEFLLDVKDNALKAYENQDYQFEALVQKLDIPRDTSRNPLFDVMFTMQNNMSANSPTKDSNPKDNKEENTSSLTFKQYKAESKIAKFDLVFSASEIGEEIAFNIEYCTKLYKEESIKRVVCQLENIFKVVASNVNVTLNEIDMLSEEAKNKILYEFNDTTVEYPMNTTLQELFEEQVKNTPDNIAVVFEDKELTYRELNARSNRLARELRKKGVKQDTIVGIVAERSIEMVVGMIGILKAGGAYLPMDPEYPEHRIKYMIEDSKTSLILTQSKFMQKILFEGEIIDLENENSYSDNAENLQNINSSKDLAYVIYTSGSTGTPKGVMIEHRSIAMTLQWRRKEYKLDSRDSILQLFSNAFDGFVTSFYTPIISGSKIILLNDNEVKDISSIKEKILKYNVTHFISVPSMCLSIMESLTPSEAEYLRIITLAGESLTANVVKKCKELKVTLEVVNEYGPTENSVVTTIMRDIKLDENITIGKPRHNTKIYILDKNNKVQPLGVIGEICIAGLALARGYINKPELTAEKFIENPFAHGEKIYKTGDLGRWTSEGNIEFIGRIDHQVKVRGYRIELGEIESNLLSHEGIKETVVIDRWDKKGIKYLCAYIVAEKELTVSELREYLSRRIPEYMIPSYFIQLDKIPLNVNGKVDKKALPEPNGIINTGAEYEAPRNEKDEMISVLWQEVLQVYRVGINDNFFDLGGNSLKMIELNNKLNKLLNKEISLITLFRYPNIKTFVNYLSSELDSDSALSKEIDRKEKVDQGKIRANQRMERMRKRGV